MKKDNSLTVSIIMNCHNGEKFLAEAINSVLNQTYKNWELIFWNNSSSVNGAYFPIILQSNQERQHVKLALENSNIPSREYFSPSLDSVYNEKGICTNSRDIASRVLCLPLHYHMSLADVKTVSQVIKSSISNKK